LRSKRRTARAKQEGEATCRAALEYGAVAQLGERLLCKQDVIGSIPVSSTISLKEGNVKRDLLDVQHFGHNGLSPEP
jgi:hypothetical protein